MNHLESNHVPIVTFNTNGYLLDEKMVQFLVEKGKTFEQFRVSFSLDAAIQKTYEKIRGKNLSRTLRNIQFLQDYKRKAGAARPTVFVNMALSRTNMKKLPDFIKLAHHLEAQVELNNLAIDKGYEAIRIQKGPNLVFDYKKEVPTAHPRLYNKYLKEADRLGERLKVPIHKAGDVMTIEEPLRCFRFFSRLEAIFGQTSWAHPQPEDLHEISPMGREKDPTFEHLPLCLLPWSQMVISSKGDISLCCVQGSFDHLKHYRSIEDAWHYERGCQIRGQLSQGLFPRECETPDCTVRRWNQRVCIVH